jgi:RNA methyltransferase, TrmH family
VAEGPKLLDEAFRAGAPIDTVFIEAAALTDHAARIKKADQDGTPVMVVADGVLARVSGTVTPQPVTTIIEMDHLGLDRLDLGGLTAVCAGIQDPGNAGTVVRSAAASGARAVIFCAGAVDLYNPKAVRASAGALFHVPVVSGVPVDAALEHLGDNGVRRLGTAVRGGHPHDQVDWRDPVALVLGSESHGLPADVSAGLDGQVTIPMQPAVESLNVAMAATVIFFEAARQRRAGTGGTG